MGQKYEGTLIIQTTNDYSPVGSQTLAALENSAFSDDILSGKSLYSQNGQLLKGSFVDGWPIEISTEEKMDAFTTLENVGRYVKYTGTASQGGGTPAPVNPIAVGDTITQLYFDTTKTPDFSLLDWSGAVDDGNGAKILVLMNGQGLSDIDAPLYIYKIDNSHPEISSLQGAIYQLVVDFSAIYTHCSSAADEALCETELGATPNQWNLSGNSITFGQIVVAVVNQQDVWGAYVSKDGQWTSGAKYTSGQVYKVVQNGDIAELKEIQY